MPDLLTLNNSVDQIYVSLSIRLIYSGLDFRALLKV